MGATIGQGGLGSDDLGGHCDLDAARAWAAELVRWYNDEDRHSGIRYVTPGQRHRGEDQAILAARHAL